METPITLVDAKYRKNLFYNNRIKKLLFIILMIQIYFFLQESCPISFLLISVFYPNFSLMVHYSLILKIVSAILNRIFHLFSMSSTARNYNKKLYTTSSDSPLNSSDKNFSYFECLLSYCINSFTWNSS